MKRGGKSKKEWRKEKAATMNEPKPAPMNVDESSPGSSSSSSSRKRNLEELLQSTRIDNNNANNAKGSPPSLNEINRVRLEAIFHPKFENEAVQDSHIRRDMKQRVSKGDGFLEVSLKHSGSLMLWSGGQRYYSKNSTDNVFTHTGEILLRQHFVRAFWKDHETDGVQNTQSTLLEDEHFYQECSRYVEEKRLTLAFEVVTAVLGDHGDRPKRDFLILTAVADRSQESFYSTQQVVKLAQRFRLPHNDFWVFSSETSVNTLFDFYDTGRETSLAPFVVQELTQSAEIVVPSMYPHVPFQGDILEGIVIRYVSNNASNDGDTNVAISMEQLSKMAKDMCALVPPSLPDCWELVENRRKKNVEFPDWLSANLRQEFYSFRKTSQSDKDYTNPFAEHVASVLGTKKRRSAPRLSKEEASKVPTLLQGLASSTSDEETQRISRVVQSLKDLNIRVDYSVMREEISGYGFSRWLCIVHVILDQSHQKYRKKMNPGDMALFRGFALELSSEHSFSVNAGPHITSSDMMDESESVTHNASDTLMLKMKFLPYMIRTFCCRNGLRNLKQGGVPGFVKFTNNLLHKWKISTDAKKKWAPFLRAWAEYAEPRLKNRLLEDGEDMPQLTSNCFLEHLERFIPLFESGEIGSNDPTSFCGFLIVVAPTNESADKAADFIAKKIKSSQRFSGAHTVPKGTTDGVVCSVSVDEKSGRFRNILADRGDPTFLVCFGCSDEDFATQISDEHTIKIRKGQLNSWKKLRVSQVFDLPLNSLAEENAASAAEDVSSNHQDLGSDVMHNCITQLLADGSKDDSDMELGLLAFFPQIPGSGKSSVLNEFVVQELRSFLSNQARPRNLQVRMGDKTPGKYWPLVKKERAKDPTGLYIADKNVPAKTWDLVANVCAESGSIGVPVIPRHAMKTTVVEGIRFPDGYVSMKRSQTFPFSLHYLAVCLLRVVSREPGSHPGKLDSLLSRSCMIVVMYFCLFERVASDDLIANIAQCFDGNSAFLAEPIEVPFFREESPPELPEDMRSMLIEAIRAQGGLNTKRKDVGKIKDDYIDELESRIRKCLEEHRSFLTSLTVDEDESRKSFLEQMKLAIERAEAADVESSFLDFDESFKTKKIRYVSVDVPRSEVHKLLLEHANDPDLKSLLQTTAGTSSLEEITAKDTRFTRDTHVTLAHHRDGMTQEAMNKAFGAITGQKIRLEATGIFWDENTAALEVALPSHTDEGQPFPPSTNKFTHITLWVQQGTKAFRSNELPALAKEGKANHYVFGKAELIGKIAFKY